MKLITPSKTCVKTRSRVASRLALVWLMCICAPSMITAQTQTPGGTQILNRANATYSDGNGNNYSTASNTVTVTVSNVSGLAITPDAGTRTSVVGGQFAIFNFRVTNTANFADQVRFLANGASIGVTGPGTVVGAVIDLDASGNITSGDLVAAKLGRTRGAEHHARQCSGRCEHGRLYYRSRAAQYRFETRTNFSRRNALHD